MPDGPPPAPVVQHVRVRYAKRGRLRFTSHRDFQRAFERALRRSAVPVAYSAGFTPHPKISYAGAAPTGVASEAEYLEIALSEQCDPQRLRAVLDVSLPAGLDVLEVGEGRTPPLAERLQASVWEIRMPGVTKQAADQAVQRFLRAAAVEVSRLTKNGIRTFDARTAVVSMDTTPWLDGPEQPPCAILRLVVRHQTPAVRPDDVLTGLRHVADLAPPTPPAVIRLAQGPLDVQTGTVSDPMASDRDIFSAADEKVTRMPPGHAEEGHAVSAPSHP
jgi:radical SAM-linked protein